MPNNINVSDYEKIIFVNNINEENSEQKSILTNNAYNFAVFFTNNTNIPNNWPTNSWGSQIRNIWYKGQRLNRFIGIDPNNSIFAVGNHTFKLNFNYERGLLSIADINKLLKIEFIKITYTNAGKNTAVEITNKSNIGVINSSDNTFILALKFTVENTDDADASRLDPDINIVSEPNIHNEYNITSCEYTGNYSLSNNKLSVIRYYKLKIKYDTEYTGFSKSYVFKSVYDSSIELPLNLTLRLNPINMTIKNASDIIVNSDLSYSNDISLRHETFKVILDPNNELEGSYPNSSANKTLWIRVQSSQESIATIGNDNLLDAWIKVESSDPTFILNITPSSELTSIITVKLYNDSQYLGISKIFNINIGNTPQITISNLGNNTLSSLSNGTQLSTNWSVNNSNIILTPTTGKTTIYSLGTVNTPKGSYTLSTNKSSINLGESIKITVNFVPNSNSYSGIVTSSKSGYISASTSVTLSKYSETPASVSLNIGNNVIKNVTLNSSGTGSLTYTPTIVGENTVSTTDTYNTNATKSFTVVDNTIVTHYYWYAGAGPIDSSTTPGLGAGWTEIAGTPSQIATGELTNDTKINWVLAVPTVLGLNHISNGEDITDAYDVTTVTCADGVEYKVFTQIQSTKRINIIFIA